MDLAKLGLEIFSYAWILGAGVALVVGNVFAWRADRPLGAMGRVAGALLIPAYIGVALFFYGMMQQL